MKKISVVISAFNEEKNITECLESVKKIADEIIVVDNTSVDKTVHVAKKYGAKIYKQPNHLMLNINKNYGFSKATSEWILNLDADERLTSELIDEIKNWKLEIKNSDVVAYWISRKNIIFGKWIQSDMWWPDYVLRLFRKENGKFPTKHVHEYIQVDGQTSYLKFPLLHNSYSSISQYINKLEKIYTENEVDNMLAKGYTVDALDAIAFPARDFIKTFLAQKGYRDGLHGLVLSMLQAFYSFIVFAKLWEKQGFVDTTGKDFLKEFYKEDRKLQKELEYWYLTQKIKEGGANSILLRFLRKVKKI